MKTHTRTMENGNVLKLFCLISILNIRIVSHIITNSSIVHLQYIIYTHDCTTGNSYLFIFVTIVASFTTDFCHKKGSYYKAHTVIYSITYIINLSLKQRLFFMIDDQLTWLDDICRKMIFFVRKLSNCCQTMSE